MQVVDTMERVDVVLAARNKRLGQQVGLLG